MAHDGGAGRRGAFRGKMDHCRESQSWTMACSSMLERYDDGKDRGENVFVLFADAILPFFGVLFRFRVLAFIEFAALLSIVFDMHASRQTGAVG